MDTLNDTNWDILIAGTGLQESLLALALSRSNKKILHVDKNDYYGGAEAALSLQDAERWVEQIAGSKDSSLVVKISTNIEQAGSQTAGSRSPFQNASIAADESRTGLSFPRAYSLALAPQIIYTRSALLPALVCSHVDSQLEFLAVGSWFVCTPKGQAGNGQEGEESQDDSALSTGSIYRVPNNREDILEDDTLDRRAKQGLMRFLRFLSDYEEQPETWSEFAEGSFDQFLNNKFNLSSSVSPPIKALVLSTLPSQQVKTRYALERIARHLRSIGLFGPGFGAVVPKWGGLAELAQVGCRAGAVGGGVYVLSNAVESIETANGVEGGKRKSTIRLKREETLTTEKLIASPENVPTGQRTSSANEVDSPNHISRSITVVSSPLTSLFPPFAENTGPTPAVAVVALPTSALSAQPHDPSTTSEHVYIMVHSSDTGECPNGQCVLYSAVTAPSSPAGIDLLDAAVAALLASVGGTPLPEALWTLRYQQRAGTAPAPLQMRDGVVVFPPASTDLAFDDGVLDQVKEAWEAVLGEEAREGAFLVLAGREDTEDAEREGQDGQGDE